MCSPNKIHFIQQDIMAVSRVCAVSCGWRLPPLCLACSTIRCYKPIHEHERGRQDCLEFLRRFSPFVRAPLCLSVTNHDSNLTQPDLLTHTFKLSAPHKPERLRPGESGRRWGGSESHSVGTVVASLKQKNLMRKNNKSRDRILTSNL